MEPVFEMPLCSCPKCKKKLDSVGGQKHHPEPGDSSVCCYCCAVLVFEKDYSLRLMTKGEWNELPWSAQVMIYDAIAHIKRVIASCN